MKLRKNKLKPLRFDSSGAYLTDHGVSKSDVMKLANEFESVRDSMVQPELEMTAGDRQIAEAEHPQVSSFYDLPQRLLREYESDRTGSELARLFKVANRFHASFDRVVVLAIGASSIGARSLMEGCCQPYWNELSRGERGSKPRIYFDGNSMDNDATQGLLHLLGAFDRKPSKLDQDAWGLVVIDESCKNSDTDASLSLFLEALKESCHGDARLVAQRLILVTASGSKLQKMAIELGCNDLFPIPDGISGGFSVLSAAGLVPAAILGINVIELLEGAVAMNEHFAKTPAEENIILQYVAVNHLLEKEHGVPIRVLSLWSKALESVGLWYDRLATERFGNEKGFTPISKVNISQLPSRQHLLGTRNKVINNIIVDTYRFDSLPVTLPVGSRKNDHDSLSELATITLPEVMQVAIANANEALRSEGSPTTNVFLPRVDELHLGQLLQMLMIATDFESRLLETQPIQMMP